MLTPLPPSDWTLEHAAHLLSRAGFGGTPDQIRALHALGLPRAVEAIFHGNGPQLPPPEWTREPATTRKQLAMESGGIMDDQEMRDMFKAAMRAEHQHAAQLRSWWLQRMRESRQPLLEKMTLFWHGHFATSIAKVKSAWLMWQQNETLRDYALGNFGEMLLAMTRDAAMMRWLDLVKSTSGEPNENFAREVMELFTLGEGHYTEDDVKAGARAFTGHRINPLSFKFVFARKVHDYDVKKFLGRVGDFNADDIVGILLAQDQCSRFVGGRIWEFLAYENPEPDVLDSVAETLRMANYDTTPLLRAIFLSQAFYSKRAVRTQIKSPVDWLVNSCIAIDAPIPRQPALDYMLSRLGQLPFAPPNVRGWVGGKSWISSSTLVLRYNMTGTLLGNGGGKPRRAAKKSPPTSADIAKIAPESLRNQPDALAEALVFRLFGTTQIPKALQRARDSIAEVPKPVTDDGVRIVCEKLMSTPYFQLT